MLVTESVLNTTQIISEWDFIKWVCPARIFHVIYVLSSLQYRGPDKSFARPGRKKANVSVRMAWISFGALPCQKKKNHDARVSMLLKPRASLTCFQACFLPGRAKDLSAPRNVSEISILTISDSIFQCYFWDCQISNSLFHSWFLTLTGQAAFP